MRRTPSKGLEGLREDLSEIFERSLSGLWQVVSGEQGREEARDDADAHAWSRDSAWAPEEASDGPGACNDKPQSQYDWSDQESDVDRLIEKFGQVGASCEGEPGSIERDLSELYDTFVGALGRLRKAVVPPPASASGEGAGPSSRVAGEGGGDLASQLAELGTSGFEESLKKVLLWKLALETGVGLNQIDASCVEGTLFSARQNLLGDPRANRGASTHRESATLNSSATASLADGWVTRCDHRSALHSRSSSFVVLDKEVAAK